MDYCKNRQFLAFINKDGKDKYWVDGGFPWSEVSPTLHPYDTKEEKLLAREIGESLSCWSETGDIEAVVLTVSNEVMSIMKKKDNALIVEKLERLNEEKKKKQVEEQLAKKQKAKLGDVEPDAPTKEIVEPVKKPQIVSTPAPVDKKLNENKIVQEKKRSPLEIKSSPKEKDKKVVPTPSEPKKKSGLSKIMEGIK